jgi:hypothetical protein
MKSVAFVLALLFVSPAAFAGICENSQTTIEIHECMLTELNIKEQRLAEVAKRNNNNTFEVVTKGRDSYCDQQISDFKGEKVAFSALLQCKIEETDKLIDLLERD